MPYGQLEMVPPGRRPMTFLELKDRATHIQAFITKQEATAMALNSNRASVDPVTFMAQMQNLAADVRTKRELLSTVVLAMNRMSCNGNDPRGGNLGNMTSASMGSQQQQASNFIPVTTQGNNGPSGNGAPWAHHQNTLISYANISTSDLCARGVPETVVQFVERNRDLLQSIQHQQQSLRDLVQRELNLPGVPEGMFPMQASPPSRPTPEQSQEAIQFVQRLKNEFIEKSLPIVKQHQVPENQKGEYSRILEQAYRCAQEVEPKLPMYFYVLKDADMVRKLIAIIYTTREQHALITNGIQKFILPLSILSTLTTQVQQVNTQFSVAVGSSAPQRFSVPPASGQSGHSGFASSTQQETGIDASSAAVPMAPASIPDDYLAELLGTMNL